MYIGNIKQGYKFYEPIFSFEHMGMKHFVSH